MVLKTFFPYLPDFITLFFNYRVVFLILYKILGVDFVYFSINWYLMSLDCPNNSELYK